MAKSDPNSSGWLHALYNNIGESYLLLKDYENARLYFHKLAELQKQRDGESDMYTLKDEARAIRLSGHPDKALSIIEPIFKKLTDAKHDDGWIREEIAENLYALGQKEKAKPQFVKAYELLSNNDYCLKYEQEKLNHIKKMAEEF